MERQHHHLTCTVDPCAGWDFVHRDWGMRARDGRGERRALAAVMAGVRRVICAVLCGEEVW